MQTEKRRHPRYQRLDMHLSVARPGFAGFLKLKPTSECTNFSRSGLRFESNQSFRVGDRLVIDLDVGDINLREMNAQVIQCHQIASGIYCTGVEFCFKAKRMKIPKVSTGLLNIEQSLRLATKFPT